MCVDHRVNEDQNRQKNRPPEQGDEPAPISRRWLKTLLGRLAGHPRLPAQIEAIAAAALFYDELLGAAGFGWMGWALREGRAISTRRDRYDGNGINGEGFHPFFTKDGSLRVGLEFLKEKPKRLAPWLNP